MKKQLGQEKIEQVIALAKEHQDYQTLFFALDELQDLSTVEMKVEEAFMVNTKDPSTPPIGKIKMAFDGKAQMEIVFEEMEDNLILHFYGAAFSPKRDELKVFTVKDKKATLFFTEKLEANPATEEGNDELATQGYSWGDFCYPYYVMGINIGYNHCGKQCGDNGYMGGGTPRNSMDECCRAHDRCYAAFGWGDCECDEILLDCAYRNRGTDIDLYWAINAYFSGC